MAWVDSSRAGRAFPGMALVAVALGGTALAGPAQVAALHRAGELRRKIEADNRFHPAASVGWAQEALSLIGGGAEPRVELWFLTALVRDATVLHDFAKAADNLERGRLLAAKAQDERGRLLLEAEAAKLFLAQEQYGNVKALVDGLLPALGAYRTRFPHDPELEQALVSAYLSLGGADRELGRSAEAILAYQSGQQVCEEIGDRAGHARILGAMGTLYSLLNRKAEATASLRSAITLAESLGDLELQASLHLALATGLGMVGDTAGELPELRLASDLAGRTRDEDIQLTAAVNLADAYLNTKDYKAALKYADAALKLSAAAGDPLDIAICQVNRGTALNRLGNSAEGLKTIQEALEHFRKAQALKYTADITGSLAEEFAFAGDYRKAYETEVLFKSLSDELMKTQDQKHIAEAGAAFENDKKQIEINALQRDRRSQARLRLLWIALGAMGFATAGVLVRSRRKLQLANTSLADMSLRDPLTALANRRYLTTRIAEDLAQVVRMQRAGQSEPGKARILVNIDVVFLMIDIDHFKHVNDQYGHAAGDQVLRQFAGILSQTMRDSDTVVRWGGEEFFVVAKHTSRGDARLVAERIRSRVEAFPFELGNGQTIHKTCSVGYSSYPFFRTDPVKVAWEKVAEIADQCLYAAKASGRNTWVGVHEVEGAPAPMADSLDAYPDVAALVASGVLSAEAHTTPITWSA